MTGTPDFDAARAARYPSLHGVPVFVTGGATGIGADIVRAFARQGAKVGFVDVDNAGAQALVASLADAATPPRFTRGDVTQVDLPPGAGDFRLIDRRVVDLLNRLPERLRFMKGLYAWGGCRHTGVPYTPPPRRHGRPPPAALPAACRQWSRQSRGRPPDREPSPIRPFPLRELSLKA